MRLPTALGASSLARRLVLLALTWSLGALLVTVDVPALPVEVLAQALDAGRARALQIQQQGLIGFAALFCQGQWRSTATRPRREGAVSVQEACTA